MSAACSVKNKEALVHYTIEGPVGYLLDADTDSLDLQSFQCIEIETLMKMGERHHKPVLIYLFRRIEKRLTGAPSLIILDEACLMLGHPVFREKIREWLKVLRNANCAVILATQSISDAERSGIIDVLSESCPTKICLPNPQAQTPAMRPFYERLGFNERQLEIIARARPKHDYHCISPRGRRLFAMGLGPLTLAFTGVSDARQIREIDALHRLHGQDWPHHRLITRGEQHALSLLETETRRLARRTDHCAAGVQPSCRTVRIGGCCSRPGHRMDPASQQCRACRAA